MDTTLGFGSARSLSPALSFPIPNTRYITTRTTTSTPRYRCSSVRNRQALVFASATLMEGEAAVVEGKEESEESMKLLFLEMGVGYDQHGQDITKATMKACRDAISSNSIPAFRRGSIPGVNSDQMKLYIKLAVPQSLQHLLDLEKVKSVFPFGTIIKVEVVDGGMICSSGVFLEEMADKSLDCYVVNAAVYVGY